MGILRAVKLLASVGLSVAVASSVLLFSWAPSEGPRKAQAATGRPNIVFILVDDMRKDDLKYMPKTRALLQSKGMTFENAFVSNALCAPSRATIMRGQYSHNTGVWSNSSTDSGGWLAYQQNGNEEDNVATRLQGAGYRTALFGKYLNGYTNTTYIPHQQEGSAERDRWFGAFINGPYRYFDYDVNDQGTVRRFGTSDNDYITDVLGRKTDAFIKNSATQSRPFFAYVAPIAPHGPATPAPRDAHAYDGAIAPRLPSFDEKDVSDKPPWIRQLPRLTPSETAAINTRHENRVESLQAVDDLVEGVVNTLNSARADGTIPLDNTYIFFTSDNGWHHGEHRIPGEKWRPYEEDVHLPLLVRGPGVAAGSTTYKPALNTDYLPTFTDLAGAQRPPYVDGRSLEPVIHGVATPRRSAILLEAAAKYSPAYEGMRTVGTPKRKYVEYADGTRELYELGPDPYELVNSYVPDAPPSDLASRLRALQGCRAGTAVTCQASEDGP